MSVAIWVLQSWEAYASKYSNEIQFRALVDVKPYISSKRAHQTSQCPTFPFLFNLFKRNLCFYADTSSWMCRQPGGQFICRPPRRWMWRWYTDWPKKNEIKLGGDKINRDRTKDHNREMVLMLTSFGSIVDDDPKAIIETFLLCNKLGDVKEIAKNLYMPFFCLSTRIWMILSQYLSPRIASHSRKYFSTQVSF